jgi:hypothetical protein
LKLINHEKGLANEGIRSNLDLLVFSIILKILAKSGCEKGNWPIFFGSAQVSAEVTARSTTMAAQNPKNAFFGRFSSVSTSKNGRR